MNAKATRIFKEARPLFWPWCALIAAGMLPLARPIGSINGLGPLAFVHALGPLVFVLGIPLLAALPMGNEFQHRTLSLLLSQPVDRMEIWREKLIVTAIAVLSPVLVISVSLWAAPVEIWRPNPVSIGAWIVAAIASATFWTLFTRSTLGSIAITIAVQGLIVLAGDMVSGASWGVTPVLSVALLLCYAVVMLWLGRRAFAHFQVTGTAAGDDLLTSGPDMMPGALAGWLRLRPTDVTLNLVRKELRLLRPVWLLTLLTTVGWIGLTAYGLMHERGQTKPFTIRIAAVHYPAAVWLLGVSSVLLVAILAGGLSLGEERTSGTHAWHMTLPVSALRQWLIKLSTALFAGFMGAVLLPIALLTAGGYLGGSPNLFLDMDFARLWLLVVLLLTFAAFWCACAANGTVRAVLWVFPALIALGLAVNFGGRAGGELVQRFVATFDPFANLRFTIAVSRMDHVAFGLASNAWNKMTDSVRAKVLLIAITIVAPTLLFAVVQSYRLFRTQLQDRTLSVVRSLLPLAVTTFLCSFSLLAFHTLVVDAWRERTALIYGTDNAIEAILRSRALEKGRSGAANPDAAAVLQLSGEDLLKALPAVPRFPLPIDVQRRLRESRVTVIPNHGHPNTNCCGDKSGDFSNAFTVWYYSATVHLADGSDLALSYEPNDLVAKRFHASIRWKGTSEEEPLRGWW